jgi:hypothetical protein
MFNISFAPLFFLAAILAMMLFTVLKLCGVLLLGWWWMLIPLGIAAFLALLEGR